MGGQTDERMDGSPTERAGEQTCIQKDGDPLHFRQTLVSGRPTIDRYRATGDAAAGRGVHGCIAKWKNNILFFVIFLIKFELSSMVRTVSRALL